MSAAQGFIVVILEHAPRAGILGSCPRENHSGCWFRYAKTSFGNRWLRIGFLGTQQYGAMTQSVDRNRWQDKSNSRLRQLDGEVPTRLHSYRKRQCGVGRAYAADGHLQCPISGLSTPSAYA